jgi:hypothetical protein
MIAAKELSICLQTMANNPAATMTAGRSQRMDGAFETIEYVGFSLHVDLEGLVIFISTHFASSHRNFSFLSIIGVNQKASGLG